MEFCICCGAIIPEGRMVCWACEHGYWPEVDSNGKD